MPAGTLIKVAPATAPARPARKSVRKTNKSKSSKSLNKKVLDVLYKTAETKSVYYELDEEQLGSQTGSKSLRAQGQNNQNLSRFPARGDSPNQREGQAINPVMWQFKGHMRIPGASAAQDNRVTMVRVIAAHFQPNEDPDRDLTSTGSLLYYNGTSRGLFNDYRDTYADINWERFAGKPFYDKVFRMKPGYLVREYDSAGVLTTVGEIAGDTVPLKIVKYFKKGTKFSCDANQDTFCNNSQGNICIMVIARNANDDTTTSTLNVEVTGSIKYMFKDF